MGKNEKTMLGRSLVKHLNQVTQQNKEKGRMYNKENKKVLESVTEVTDIEAVLEQAEESERLFSSENPTANVANVFNLDKGSSSVVTAEDRKLEEELHASSLRVPRRPAWHSKMSAEELDANEKQSFLVWRRTLASLEENEKLVLTPFEKNLDIWRQLWRVLERSDLIVMVVDARDPLFYRCPDLEDYAREIDEHKETLLLINKADLLPLYIREKWAQYFNENNILFLFWSAKAATATLEGKQLKNAWHRQNVQHGKDDETKIYGRDELLARLQVEAENIVKLRSTSNKEEPSHHHGRNGGNHGRKHVVVGFVGYPNVGKSSTINALVGEKKTGVTSTPGKTKHFQTLIISEELMLCDCPGLVFPSFSSSRYEMIASGVLPIHRMTEHREAIQVVANRVPRQALEEIYNIKLPKPKPYEPQSRPPLAAELLRAYCASRGWVASSGLPDETKAARQILKDYIDGKLPHFELPPGSDTVEIALGSNVASHSSDDDEDDIEDDYSEENPSASELDQQPDIEHVLDDLTSFDVSNGLASKKTSAVKKKAIAPHKQHKKPLRSKNRSWRVGSDGTDGTPIVRVFQKPINTGPAKIE